MESTYWLFGVLIAGFLALEEHLNHIDGLLAEINATGSARWAGEQMTWKPN